jgi:protein SCO1
MDQESLPMPDQIKLRVRSISGLRALAAVMVLGAALAGCSSPKPAAQRPRRYPLQGRVVAIDKPANQVTVDAGDIPGFMSAMEMPYAVKDPQSLDSLAAGDQVTADVVVNDKDVKLENVVVVKKAAEGKAASPNDSHPTPAKSPKP